MEGVIINEEKQEDLQGTVEIRSYPIYCPTMNETNEKLCHAHSPYAERYMHIRFIQINILLKHI